MSETTPRPKGLILVRRPGETYLAIRDNDGDRELNDAGMEWERYIAPAVIVLNENPVLLRPDLKLAV